METQEGREKPLVVRRVKGHVTGARQETHEESSSFQHWRIFKGSRCVKNRMDKAREQNCFAVCSLSPVLLRAAEDVLILCSCAPRDDTCLTSMDFLSLPLFFLGGFLSTSFCHRLFPRFRSSNSLPLISACIAEHVVDGSAILHKCKPPAPVNSSYHNPATSPLLALPF